MKYFLSIFFVGFFHVSASAIGHDQGNGGYVIECPGYTGSFSLDYVLVKEEFEKQNVSLVQASDANQSLVRIAKLLLQKTPKLGVRFQNYLNHLQNKTDSTKPYIWYESYGDVPDLEDQDFNQLPVFCRARHGTVPQIRQAIHRVVRNLSHTEFYYDPDTMMALPSMQRSFLFVHEWLWDISSDVKKNRKVNYFLHSELLKNMSSEEVNQYLQNLGLVGY